MKPLLISCASILAVAGLVILGMGIHDGNRGRIILGSLIAVYFTVDAVAIAIYRHRS